MPLFDANVIAERAKLVNLDEFTLAKIMIQLTRDDCLIIDIKGKEYKYYGLSVKGELYLKSLIEEKTIFGWFKKNWFQVLSFIIALAGFIKSFFFK